MVYSALKPLLLAFAAMRRGLGRPGLYCEAEYLSTERRVDGLAPESG
jgi:hypothetical protein